MRITQHSPFALEDAPETVEKIRKGRGRLAAYTSSKPAVRRAVRLTGETEMRKIVRAARSLKVTLRCQETLEEIRDLAYENYCEITVADGRTPMERPRLHPNTMDRLTVNYLRHSRTSYDQSLLRSRFSTNDLRACYNKEVKVRCLDEIAGTYPELVSECERQRMRVTSSLAEAVEAMDSNQAAA